MPLAKPFPSESAIGRHLVAALILGLLFAVLGPFGSYPALNQPTRYGFWMGLILFGYFCALTAALAADKIGPLAGRHPVIRVILVALGSAVPVSFATAWALSQVQTGRIVSVQDMPALFGAVLSVQFALAFVQHWISNAGVGGSDSGTATAAATLNPSESAPDVPQRPERREPARFMAHIPAHLGRDLLAVEAVNHYLRVHTRDGATLIHMRMSDAIEELQGADGLQVHRSWWVARPAVAGQRRSGARLSLVLANGIVVPVSRTFLMAVRKIGWPVENGSPQARPEIATS
jgi:DNA-binding LytR/AlgR family response regulator